MNYKIVPNILVMTAVILGVALFKQFDFQNLQFEKPALAVVYTIAFIISIGSMIKKSKDE